MSLQKFKTFDEAEKALWNFNPDENYFRTLSDLFDLTDHLNPPRCERGIHKFKTLEQADKHRIRSVFSKK